MVWALLLIALALVFAAAFRPMRNSPPNPEPTERPQPAHPWASGIKGDSDDFSGPQNLYGPGTDQEGDT